LYEPAGNGAMSLVNVLRVMVIPVVQAR